MLNKTFAIDYGAADFDLGSQDLDHGSSKFEFGSMGYSLHPFICLVSFLRLIETICKQLPSQCSRFSLIFFASKDTILLVTFNGELD